MNSDKLKCAFGFHDTPWEYIEGKGMITACNTRCRVCGKFIHPQSEKEFECIDDLCMHNLEIKCPRATWGNFAAKNEIE